MTANNRPSVASCRKMFLRNEMTCVRVCVCVCACICVCVPLCAFQPRARYDVLGLSNIWKKGVYMQRFILSVADDTVSLSLSLSYKVFLRVCVCVCVCVGTCVCTLRLEYFSTPPPPPPHIDIRRQIDRTEAKPSRFTLTAFSATGNATCTLPPVPYRTAAPHSGSPND